MLAVVSVPPVAVALPVAVLPVVVAVVSAVAVVDVVVAVTKSLSTANGRETDSRIFMCYYFSFHSYSVGNKQDGCNSSVSLLKKFECFGRDGEFAML